MTTKRSALSLNQWSWCRNGGSLTSETHGNTFPHIDPSPQQILCRDLKRRQSWKKGRRTSLRSDSCSCVVLVSVIVETLNLPQTLNVPCSSVVLLSVDKLHIGRCLCCITDGMLTTFLVIIVCISRISLGRFFSSCCMTKAQLYSIVHRLLI